MAATNLAAARCAYRTLAERTAFCVCQCYHHPVFNLASVSTIVGQAAETQMSGDEPLQEALLGSPLGFSDALGYIAAGDENPQQRWVAGWAGKVEGRAAENRPTQFRTVLVEVVGRYLVINFQSAIAERTRDVRLN